MGGAESTNDATGAEVKAQTPGAMWSQPAHDKRPLYLLIRRLQNRDSHGTARDSRPDQEMYRQPKNIRYTDKQAYRKQH